MLKSQSQKGARPGQAQCWLSSGPKKETDFGPKLTETRFQKWNQIWPGPGKGSFLLVPKMEPVSVPRMEPNLVQKLDFWGRLKPEIVQNIGRNFNFSGGINKQFAT
jgi:hypothetical protein